MRTALVCVRTPVAAQSIAAYAARLGVTTVRTAVSETEALAQLSERPAELVLADTAVTKPHTVGFVRQALALSPTALLLLFGTDEPHIAAAAAAAGARGLIRTGDHDVVAAVTKALLLIGSRQPVAASECAGQCLRAVIRRTGAAYGRAAPDAAGGSSGEPGHLVPAQRTDAGKRRIMPFSLTERELQVLRGMSEGKSNAEIGRALFLSEQTVKTHARRLFRKLRVRDRAQAVAVGFRSGTLS